jgi:hypothetical protein
MYSRKGKSGSLEFVDVIWILSPNFLLQLTTHFKYRSFSTVLATIYFYVNKERTVCCVENGYFIKLTVARWWWSHGVDNCQKQEQNMMFMYSKSLL